MRSPAAHFVDGLSTTRQTVSVRTLRAELAAFSETTSTEINRDNDVVVTPWANLSRSRLHEWFGVESTDEKRNPHNAIWTPPLAVMLNAAVATARETDDDLLLWIGRRVWPYGGLIPANVLRRCVWIDPANDAERLWAVDLALRTPGVGAVIADGSRFSLQATRRLQLAAEAGGALAMLARPPQEARKRSAAAYRWSVQTTTSVNDEWRQRITLLRNKDARSDIETGTAITIQLERSDAEGVIAVPAVVADRTATTAIRDSA